MRIMAGNHAVRNVDPVRHDRAAAWPDAETIFEVISGCGAAMTVCIPGLWTLFGAGRREWRRLCRVQQDLGFDELKGLFKSDPLEQDPPFSCVSLPGNVEQPRRDPAEPREGRVELRLDGAGPIGAIALNEAVAVAVP